MKPFKILYMKKKMVQQMKKKKMTMTMILTFSEQSETVTEDYNVQ